MFFPWVDERSSQWGKVCRFKEERYEKVHQLQIHNFIKFPHRTN